MKLLAISFAALVLTGAVASAEVADEWGDSGDCLNRYQRPIRVSTATGNDVWMSVNTRTKFCRGGYTNGLMGEVGEGGNNGDAAGDAGGDHGGDHGGDCGEGGGHGGGEGGPK